jgi:ligand-binding sensor domain-containing protein
VLSDCAQSADGDLWISSNDGIYQHKMENDSVQLIHWSTSKGIPAGKINSIDADRNGTVWFSMYSGFWRLNPQSMQVKQVTATAKPSGTTSVYIDDQNVIYLGSLPWVQHV